MKTINTQFNTIENISNDATIVNKSAAYLAACDEFELQATELSKQGGFIKTKIAEEVSLAYNKAKGCDNEYSIYAAAHACEIWFSKINAKSFTELMG